MAHKFSTSYIEDSLSLFRYYKKLGEGAMRAYVIGVAVDFERLLWLVPDFAGGTVAFAVLTGGGRGGQLQNP